MWIIICKAEITTCFSIYEYTVKKSYFSLDSKNHHKTERSLEIGEGTLGLNQK